MSELDNQQHLKLVREKISAARKFIPAPRAVSPGVSERSGIDIALEYLADALETLTFIVDQR